MPETKNTSPSLNSPNITIKVIDLRDLGMTDYNELRGFIRHFRDIFIRASVFAYCKNDYYCTTEAGYYTHFWPFQLRGGVCYDGTEMHNYFLRYHSEIDENSRKGKVPTEEEIERKIIDYLKNNVKMPLQKMEIRIFKVYEAERTLWIVMLPKECFW
jgi:hypothetical protein